MSYVSLYRKYRPKSFSDVVGQEVVVNILKNSILNNKIGHAYIFSGPRGTGKTSIAKIFSKAVNCLSNKNGDLCGECDVCSLNLDDDIDIIEIDAASNNGVDEIREIRNNVKLLPSHLNYKVYIIDEVHMLSSSAFNALLKTLEEPPKNIIFILATTEFNKIPATVVSRCQKFDFKKLTNSQISSRLKYILNQENKSLSDNVIELISSMSEGGLRDAINLLDQVISLNKDSISVDDVYSLTGGVSNVVIFDILKEFVSSDVKEILSTIDTLHEQGKNWINICERVQKLIRDIIIYNSTKNYFDKEYENKLQEYSKVDTDLLINISEELFKLINDLKKTINQRIIVEIYFLKLSLLFRKKEDCNKIKVNENINKEIINNEELIDEKLKKIRINNSFCGASKELKSNFTSGFVKIKEYISNKDYNSISNLLLKSNVEVVSDKNIIFTFKNRFEIVLFDKNIIEIEKFLKIIFNNSYLVVAITKEEWEKYKNEYINNIKNGVKYNYIDEPKKEKKSRKTNEFESTMENIFGSDIIEEN